MKALILDYTDGTAMTIEIPKGWEENASEFVESLPCYHNDCMHMIFTEDIEVYKIVEDGMDTDGYPCYDYQHIATL